MSTVNSVEKAFASIWLPYFKQGDDLHACLVTENGKVNVKETLSHHIKLLGNAINHLQQIHDAIPDENDLEIEGDTHHIGICGDKALIQKLNDSKLVDIEDPNSGDDSDCEQDPCGSNDFNCCVIKSSKVDCKCDCNCGGTCGGKCGCDNCSCEKNTCNCDCNCGGTCGGNCACENCTCEPNKDSCCKPSDSCCKPTDSCCKPIDSCCKPTDSCC